MKNKSEIVEKLAQYLLDTDENIGFTIEMARIVAEKTLDFMEENEHNEN